jgi:WD40 repeat protein
MRWPFSPDGRLLAFGGENRAVHLWDVVNRRQLAVLWGHTGDITSVAFSADGRRVVPCQEERDGNVRLWDVELQLPGQAPHHAHQGPNSAN